tara:strand:- start:1629 stop:3236 length:1608 start_codon:yes stop_codon:yes gene_type:complete
MSDKISILDSGRMTQDSQFSVTVNGRNVVVRESIILDVQNGNYGKTSKIVYKTGGLGRQKWLEVNSKSDVGKAILEDEDGARGNAYRNTIDKVRNLSKKQALSNVVAHDNALRESGMFEIATGIESHIGTPFPEKENVKKDITTEEGGVDETTPAGTTNDKKKVTTVLIYPKDMSKKQDYIYIEAFEYKAPQQSSLRQNKQVQVPNRVRAYPFTNAKERSKIKKYKNVDARDTETQEKFGFTNTITSGLQRGNNVGGQQKDIIGTVRLPIPNSIKSSNGVDWGEGRANALEAGAFLNTQSAISNVLGGKKNIGGLIGSGVGELQNLLKDLPEIGQGQSGQLLSSVLARTALAQLNINVDPSQFIARSTGMAINPNLELLFSSPKLRTFTFVFQFAPDDEDEATMVRKIQRFFKQGMLPTNSSGGDAGAKLYLGSPNVYRLCYRNNGRRIKGLNIFKICALTSCEINFTPENVYQAYEDEKAVSMPVRSFMSLTFTELTPIFANDYDDPNFDDPSLEDIKPNILGKNKITEDDIGF